MRRKFSAYRRVLRISDRGKDKILRRLTLISRSIYWLIQQPFSVLHSFFLSFDSILISFNLLLRRTRSLRRRLRVTDIHKKGHEEKIIFSRELVLTFPWRHVFTIFSEPQQRNCGKTNGGYQQHNNSPFMAGSSVESHLPSPFLSKPFSFLTTSVVPHFKSFPALQFSAFRIRTIQHSTHIVR